MSSLQLDDWHWQLRNRLRASTPEELSSILELVGSREMPGKQVANVLSDWGACLTPYQAGLIRRLNDEGNTAWADQFAKTLIPSAQEYVSVSHRAPCDGTGIGPRKAHFGEYPRVLKRLYQDRVILMPCMECSSSCRYCFRRNEANRAEARISQDEIQAGVDYIRSWNEVHPGCPIRDVILSGGDPLSLTDSRLERLLDQIHRTPGVEVIRVDTKYPASCPQRTTPNLARILAKYVHIICLDFCHPAELTTETIDACRRLASQGIILRSYIPLLGGVNDSREVLRQLFWGLLAKCKVTPYYLVHFIETQEGNHFKVSIEKGLEIMDSLQVEMSGTAIPNYIAYLPQGGGKAKLPQDMLYRTDEGYWLRSPITGKPALYPDPVM